MLCWLVATRQTKQTTHKQYANNSAVLDQTWLMASAWWTPSWAPLSASTGRILTTAPSFFAAAPAVP